MSLQAVSDARQKRDADKALSTARLNLDQADADLQQAVEQFDRVVAQMNGLASQARQMYAIVELRTDPAQNPPDLIMPSDILTAAQGQSAYCVAVLNHLAQRFDYKQPDPGSL